MPKSQRLIQLIMIINARKTFTVQELADELGLSTRTISRDLQELGALGVPIYSVQGRGGGYRLLRERLLPPIAFSEGEAVAIFFACQSLGFFGSLPFDEGAATALHKFYHYLPADMKEQIDRLKDRVAIWSPERIMSPAPLRTLLQALMSGSVVTIAYSSGQGETRRDIQPIGLYASSGYWYCPAYCYLRQEVRQFRADRIRSAALNPTHPGLPEVGEMTLWNSLPELDGAAETVEFTIELTPRGVWTLASNNRFGPAIVRGADGGGTATVRIGAKDLTFYADLAWRMGEDARITAPAEAVAYVRGKIEAMRARYT
ncbi:helix-turn-helix transcriptional regulator [Cohnella nanjingensis]|uniref:YafY family transcriptional regulator n=1 Tax=Cohnella nanjingensis TaxID=1387779 RepID=A0A7X0RRD8_9BACL|nr:YafY family protein [Cohnella nanjingensis]MBB6672141.1 YafY family transcriptional regulator [Cohnella nanjingensis]